MTPNDAREFIKADLPTLGYVEIEDASDEDGILFKMKREVRGVLFDAHVHIASFELHVSDEDANRELIGDRYAAANSMVVDAYTQRIEAEKRRDTAARAQIELDQAAQMLRDKATDENRQLREEILRLRLRILQLEAPNSPEAIAAAKAAQG